MGSSGVFTGAWTLLPYIEQCFPPSRARRAGALLPAGSIPRGRAIPIPPVLMELSSSQSLSSLCALTVQLCSTPSGHCDYCTAIISHKVVGKTLLGWFLWPTEIKGKVLKGGTGLLCLPRSRRGSPERLNSAKISLKYPLWSHSSSLPAWAHKCCWNKCWLNTFKIHFKGSWH